MKETTYEEILDELNQIDVKDRYDDSEIQPDNNKFKELEENVIESEESCVLGYDIYKYSQFEKPQQNLIPFVFELLYQETIRFCQNSEKELFSGISFNEIFISTGDGGFIIFNNPLQAIIFNTIFFGHLHTFNSGRLYPKLGKFIGPITIRSCMTRDNVFHYQNNYYGPAIITNSRILSKDKLNRFLIDENTYQWFLQKINGIENITELTIEDINSIFKDLITVENTLFFSHIRDFSLRIQSRKHCNFKSCHLQKIGTILAKSDTMSVYNIELQAYLYLCDEKDISKGKTFTVSVGNLNCTGIGEI